MGGFWVGKMGYADKSTGSAGVDGWVGTCTTDAQQVTPHLAPAVACHHPDNHLDRVSQLSIRAKVY